MPRKKTWKIIEAGEGFNPNSEILLSCPDCGNEAWMPYHEITGNYIIAATGLSVIYDRYIPRFYDLPKQVYCRKCRHEFKRELNKHEQLV